ncbi:FAD-binding oxidoreductase [Dokdonella sp.]|uniref:FAD-dependent oxidoreductase n=1 Tax=Dokdonella sp. TaxID=2291710 RepID=UPI002F42537A
MRGYAVAEGLLSSFDRQFHARCALQNPDRYRLLDALPEDAPRIARGAGVSYVAASFGNGAISQSLDAFDRLLAFDVDRGRLVVEAGARVGELQRFLLGHGWYLPVAPGHPQATVGGCIAADVHGKNPARDGTFRACVDALVVHRPGGEPCVASREREPELFASTFAGFGLTGTIGCATLRLARPPRALVVRRVPVANLAEAARVLRDAANAPVLYGWHDGTSARFGRGVIHIGLASDEDTTHGGEARSSSDLPAAIAPLPLSLWNRVGIAAANRWLDRRWRRADQAPMPLAEALFPLNRARLYFAGFGRAGMAEAQWLVPHPRFEAFAAALGELVARTRPRITLIASKLFAGAADGFSFDGRGVALAIHVADPAARSERAFLDALAEIAVGHAGRPNLIKDSTLDGGVARRAIDGFDEARARIGRQEPLRRCTSELARRLGL